MKTKFISTLLFFILILSGWALLRTFYITPTHSNAVLYNPVFDRVTDSNTLRVGYLILPPYLNKDTATGNLSGIFYDFSEELGKRLKLRVEWVEEVNLANLSIGLESARYDMIAFPLWRSAARARNVAFSKPLFYSTIGAYVADNDNRFDSSLEAINSKDIRVATIDGELAENIAKEDFPNAQHVALPQFSDYSQMLLQVATGKADITFFNRVFAKRFIKQNPGKIKDISGEQPIRVFAECFVLPLKDPVFKNMIDITTQELIENGFLDQLFVKYNENPADYYRVALPYRTPE